MITADEARNKSKQFLSVQKENTAKWINGLLPTIEKNVLAACDKGHFEMSMPLIVIQSEKTQSTYNQVSGLQVALEKFGYEVKLNGIASRSDKYEYDYTLLLKWPPHRLDDVDLKNKYVLRDL